MFAYVFYIIFTKYDYSYLISVHIILWYASCAIVIAYVSLVYLTWRLYLKVKLVYLTLYILKDNLNL